MWLYLSDFLQTTLHLGATWKLVLGVVFVLLVCFLRHGLIGGIADLYALATRPARAKAEPHEAAPITGMTAEEEQKAARNCARQNAGGRRPCRQRTARATITPARFFRRRA